MPSDKWPLKRPPHIFWGTFLYSGLKGAIIVINWCAGNDIFRVCKQGRHEIQNCDPPQGGLESLGGGGTPVGVSSYTKNAPFINSNLVTSLLDLLSN